MRPWIKKVPALVILILMKDILALVTIMLWPVIPIYWIPVHFATEFFRKLGRLTYLLIALMWLLVAYSIFINRAPLIAHRTVFPISLLIAGVILLAAGTLLHIWTANLLSLSGIIGIPEIVTPQKSKLIDKGPFAVVRHPTYLAHTMIFLGIYFITGVTAVGILTLADFIVVNAALIPFEEKELLQRLGEPYRRYITMVPRMIPRISRKR